MTKETIICQCLEEINNLVAKATCTQCKREILTSQELKELRAQYDKQAHDLRAKSAHIDIELHLRSVRKPSRDYLLKEDFYAKGYKKEFTKKEKAQQDKMAEAMSLLQQV
jgi:hypothetical protein